MTIEEAIGMSADQLELMDEAACKLHFDHYLIVTRPEQVAKAPSRPEQTMLKVDPQYEKARQLAATMGITLPVHTQLKKKGK